MVTTGWLPEEPDAAPAMPLTSFIVSQRAGADRGHTLTEVLTRAAGAPDKPVPAPDPDERAAGLLGRGYAPGLVTDLSQRLSAVETELETEWGKVEAGKRAAERVGRMRAAGLPPLECWRRLEGDFGDEARVARLERRAGRLREQLAGAQAMIAPPQQRDLGPVEAASARAQQILAEVGEEFRRADEAAERARQQMKRDRRRFYARWGR